MVHRRQCQDRRDKLLKRTNIKTNMLTTQRDKKIRKLNNNRILSNFLSQKSSSTES